MGQFGQRAGMVHGRRGERVGLEGYPQARDAHVRVGLERIRCQVRPADEIGLGDLERVGQGGDVRTTVKRALTGFHHRQERWRQASETGQLDLTLTAPSAQRAEPRADGYFVHGSRHLLGERSLQA
jgi:hypothetical protein